MNETEKFPDYYSEIVICPPMLGEDANFKDVEKLISTLEKILVEKGIKERDFELNVAENCPLDQKLPPIIDEIWDDAMDRTFNF